MNSYQVYQLVSGIKDQSQDALIIREALLRVFRAMFLDCKEVGDGT